VQWMRFTTENIAIVSFDYSKYDILDILVNKTHRWFDERYFSQMFTLKTEVDIFREKITYFKYQFRLIQCYANNRSFTKPLMYLISKYQGFSPQIAYM
jgi:hypothetical protein